MYLYVMLMTITLCDVEYRDSALNPIIWLLSEDQHSSLLYMYMYTAVMVVT